MPKKKPFIDKKTAASFHIIHQPNSAAVTADAVHAAAPTDPDSTAAVSLRQHGHDASTSTPFSSSSRYLFQPSRSTVRIPAGFPSDLLLSANAAQLEAMDAAERRVKRRRERDSHDGALLPHEYDYSSHMREMGGGTFIAATGSREAGAAAGGSKRERRAEAATADADVRAQQPRVPDELDAEIDWRLVRQAEREAERLRAALGRTGQLATMPADLLAALDERAEETTAGDGEEEEAAAVPAGFDELEDDFVLQAMAVQQAGAGRQHDDDDDEDGVWDEGDDDDSEYELQMGDEKAVESKEEDASLRGLWQRRGREVELLRAERKREDKEEEVDEDDDEWQEDAGSGSESSESSSAPLPPISASSGGGLDAEFDRLLSEYGDADIGGLDEADEAEVSGQLPLSSFAAAMDSFLSRQQRPLAEGGAVLVMDDRERELISRSMQRRLAVMQREDDAAALSVEEAEHWLPEVYRSAVKDDWDVQSIVSTFSNTENRPAAITEQSSDRSSRASAAARHSVVAAAISRSASQLQAATAASAAAEDGSAAASGEDGVRNLGEARPRGETAEERRLRKAAAKSERRNVRQRKKQLRKLYSSVQQQQQQRQRMSSKDNPPAVRL